jgi:hypothetical protein
MNREQTSNKTEAKNTTQHNSKQQEEQQATIKVKETKRHSNGVKILLRQLVISAAMQLIKLSNKDKMTPTLSLMASNRYKENCAANTRGLILTQYLIE